MFIPFYINIGSEESQATKLPWLLGDVRRGSDPGSIALSRIAPDRKENLGILNVLMGGLTNTIGVSNIFSELN